MRGSGEAFGGVSRPVPPGGRSQDPRPVASSFLVRADPRPFGFFVGRVKWALTRPIALRAYSLKCRFTAAAKPLLCGLEVHRLHWQSRTRRPWVEAPVPSLPQDFAPLSRCSRGKREDTKRYLLGPKPRDGKLLRRGCRRGPGGTRRNMTRDNRAIPVRRRRYRRLRSRRPRTRRPGRATSL
jgi:hypothetical protein